MHLDVLKETLFGSSIIAERDPFVIKFVETEEELEKVLRLRYRVFNLEQGKGLDAANQVGIDRDEFDDHCLHLIIVDKNTNDPVGTYRIHFGPVAKQARGLYSSREFELNGIESIIDDCVEVGRSCVDPEYRTGAVVALLWTGIALVLRKSKYRFMMGCVSLENEDPAIGWALYEHFQEKELVAELLHAEPKAPFLLEYPGEARVNDWLARRQDLLRQIPPLFKGYLRLGTKICGKPALDFEFGTVDFLILLDLAKLPERYWRHFS